MTNSEDTKRAAIDSYYRSPWGNLWYGGYRTIYNTQGYWPELPQVPPNEKQKTEMKEETPKECEITIKVKGNVKLTINVEES